MKADKIVLRSELEGRWYEADPVLLRRELEGYLEKADSPKLDPVQALILPHAGYVFSGQTVAHGLRLLRGRSFSRVVVMGPSHRIAMPNHCSLPPATHYATPFGEVELDRAFMDRLRHYPEFRSVPQAHRGENSVQIHVPFLHAVLGDFRLVPIVVGQVDLPAARRIAAILRTEMDPDTLVIASTDFTHYGPGYGYVPFQENPPENIEKLDMGAFEFIRAKDPAGFFTYIDRTGATICGKHPVGILLAMLPETSEVNLLHYDQSGRMTGDYQMSCSYLAAAVVGPWEDASEEPTADAEEPERPALSPEDRARLLRLARESIAFAFKHRRAPEMGELETEITPGMKQVMGTFVTLHKNGELRGCIGEIFPRRELYRAVIEQALNAAFQDPRFPALRPEELETVDLEISALMQPWPIPSWRDFVVGRHGIVMEKEGRSSVFLPQVAPEQGWDAEETLRHLALKAGLPADAWKEGANFRVFEALVFGEQGAP